LLYLAEIHLHRHKTVIRACRGRLKSGSVNEQGVETMRNGKGVGKVRYVKLVKESTEGLGISITVSNYKNGTFYFNIYREDESTVFQF
jgi:hypothetical protein